MSEEHVINSVNRHYLDRVMHLADESDIKATEDIFDARGMKLVAKGARISRQLQERLIARRLSKPFESCIAVEAGVDIDMVAREARRIAEQPGPVRSILSAPGSGPSPVKVLMDVSFGSAMSTMLTIIQRGGHAALEHSVMVSLVSICLAHKFGLGIQEQTAVALAGLLHDIGELYIEPEYLNLRRRLYPHEWRHVVVHPRIGQMLIAGLENYPALVADAVFEHHERFDGGGYPRQIRGRAISRAGQVISVAEVICGIFTSKSRPLERAELALKIVPGEHAHELVSTVSSAMQAARSTVDIDNEPGTAEAHCDDVRALYERLGKVIDAAASLLQETGSKAARLARLLEATMGRAVNLQRVFSSTGLDVCVSEDQGLAELTRLDILFETAVATREIQWRLRDIARDLSLHGATLEPEEQGKLQSLITLLDGEDGPESQPQAA